MQIKFDDLIISKYEISLLLHIVDGENKIPLKLRKISQVKCIIKASDERQRKSYSSDIGIIISDIKSLLGIPEDIELILDDEVRYKLNLFTILDPDIPEYLK